MAAWTKLVVMEVVRSCQFLRLFYRQRQENFLVKRLWGVRVEIGSFDWTKEERIPLKYWIGKKIHLGFSVS